MFGRRLNLPCAWWFWYGARLWYGLVNINSVHNWQDTHMITTIIFYITIVGLLAYAAYLRGQLRKR